MGKLIFFFNQKMPSQDTSYGMPMCVFFIHENKKDKNSGGSKRTSNKGQKHLKVISVGV